MNSRVRTSSSRAWAVVTAIGVVVLLVVIGLSLFPRLNDGQDVVDGLAPSVEADRVATARGGVSMVSSIVDLADPVVLQTGGGSDEVSALLAYVSAQTGLGEPEVAEAVQSSFPHLSGLLRATPLEAVTAELPALVSFLSTTLNLPEDQVVGALEENFPRLAQAIASLPKVTDGWTDVPDTPGTRFDGAEITTAPDVRSYFSDDVVPVLERQAANLRNVGDLPGGVDFLPPLLLAVGLIVVAFGVAMMVLSRDGGTPRPLAVPAWAIVVVVGVFVEVVVFGFQLYPRLGDAQAVLDDAKPAFTADRLASDIGGISFISSVADTLDPLVLESGGAAAEVPELVSFVAAGAGLSSNEALRALADNFPHVLGLLQALPLEAVNAEIAPFVTFLSTTIGITEDQVLAMLSDTAPRLAQSIAALPVVVSGWSDVPDTPGSRFDGSVISSVPDVRSYFEDDLIPAVAEQADAFDTLESTWPPTTFFPPLLTVVGLLVIAYGAYMLWAAKREVNVEPSSSAAGGWVLGKDQVSSRPLARK